VSIDFTREALRGLDVEWFAVDRRGCLAMSTPGHGAIPGAVFESEERLGRLSEFFGARPERSEAKLAERLSAVGGHESFLAEARRGPFSYSHRSYSTLDPYELIALPLTPATVGDLPAEIQAMLRPFGSTIWSSRPPSASSYRSTSTATCERGAPQGAASRGHASVSWGRAQRRMVSRAPSLMTSTAPSASVR
jgi:hypothetical protein